MSPLKTKIYLLFTIITLTTYFYSCKKEPGSDTLNSEIRQKLRDWYNTNVSESKQNPFNTLTPNWDKVQIKEVKGQIVYEVSMNNPEKVFIGYADTNQNKAEEIYSRTDIRFLIFEDKQTSLLVNGCYMSINNSGTQNNVKSLGYKETSDFTGNIIYFNPTGKMANGWTYRDGAVLQRISVSNETEYKSMMRIRSDENRLNQKNDGKLAYRPAAYCTPEYRIIYGTSCAGVDGYMNCQQYVVGREYINNCEYGGGGADGEYTPPNPTGGGTGSGSTTVLEITTDSVKKKFPCTDKLILQPIVNSASMSTFVQPFLNGNRPTITYKTSNTLAWGTTSAGGVYMLGETGPDLQSGLGYSSTVTFNEKMLQNSSPLLIAATTIHETIHAYINHNIAESIQSPNDYGNWMTSLVGYYLINQLPSNYSHHSVMLDSYFDQAVLILYDWTKTQSRPYTIRDAAMAMMYGLKTVEPGTPQTYINYITASYEDIKAKYGITTKELEQYHKEQLTSILKMPQTGCN